MVRSMTKKSILSWFRESRKDPPEKQLFEDEKNILPTHDNNLTNTAGKITAGKIPSSSNGIIVKKYQKCGKPKCRCNNGVLHGPYLWRVKYDSKAKSKRIWKYIGPAKGSD